MKTLIFTVSIFILTDIHAQVTFDKTIEQQYQDAYDKLPAWLKEKDHEAYKDTAFYVGTVVLTEYIIDTLNKDEVTTKIDFKGDTTPSYNLSFCAGLVKSDTLFIGIGTQFFSQSIQHTIFKNSVRTNYNQYRDNDSIFRTEITNNKTSDLTISAETIHFILNDDKFATDKIIYGYAEIVTRPYFEDAYFFRNGYIKKRLKYKYYFQFKPTKNGT